MTEKIKQFQRETLERLQRKQAKEYLISQPHLTVREGLNEEHLRRVREAQRIKE